MYWTNFCLPTIRLHQNIFEKYFDVNELWAGKNSFSTYVCYTLDSLIWTELYATKMLLAIFKDSKLQLKITYDLFGKQINSIKSCKSAEIQDAANENFVKI